MFPPGSCRADDTPFTGKPRARRAATTSSSTLGLRCDECIWLKKEESISVKSFTVALAPCCIRTCSLRLDLIPITIRALDATALLTPERESSKTIHSSGLAPRRAMAASYGSGCGLARVHSAPMMRKSIRRRKSKAVNSASAVFLGQLVTQAERIPFFSAHVKKSMSPDIGFRRPSSLEKIVFRNSMSFRVMIFFTSAWER
mmetsp:Transcript_4363/g.10224  ORF Transcript_4363/g.10224 Transcript_4363/m.10224 type:complete len:201 (-) Transcript_4363:1753-2355(-)